MVESASPWWDGFARQSLLQRFCRRVSGRSVSCLVLVMMLSGCGGPENSNSIDEGICSDHGSDFCKGVSDHRGAYDPVHGLFYCKVEQMRDQVVSGEVELNNLMDGIPNWGGDSSYLDGEPIIVDIRKVPSRVVEQREGVVVQAGREAGAEMDADEYQRCIDGMSQEVLEEELGGPLRAES